MLLQSFCMALCRAVRFLYSVLDATAGMLKLRTFPASKLTAVETLRLDHYLTHVRQPPLRSTRAVSLSCVPCRTKFGAGKGSDLTTSSSLVPEGLPS